jgi:hypothetical protein
VAGKPGRVAPADPTGPVATGRRARGAVPVRVTATGPAGPAASVRPAQGARATSRARVTIVGLSPPTAEVRATSRIPATPLDRGSGSATTPASSRAPAPRGATAREVPVQDPPDREPHVAPAASGVRVVATGPAVPRVRRSRLPPVRARGRTGARSSSLNGLFAPGRTAGPYGTGRTAVPRRARSPVTGRTAAPRKPSTTISPGRSSGLSAPPRGPGSRPALVPAARHHTARARVAPAPAPDRGGRTMGSGRTRAFVRTTHAAPSR